MSGKIDRVALDVFVPHGKIRAAINVGNGVLAGKHPETGELYGVSVSLAKELARELDLELDLVEYQAAGKVVEAVDRNEWDLAFLAVDPLRAETILFTEPYVAIKGAYLVRSESPFQSVNEVDRDGVRIAVGRNAAYDLFLSRSLQKAELVRAPTTPGAVDLFLEEKLDIAAGIAGPLSLIAKKDKSLRVLDGSFMEIHQAMAIPRRTEEVKGIIDDFIRRMLSGGFVRQKLIENAQDPKISA